jgi:prepilin-type N-terminal cleavage/methylation domain-containing protein
MKHNSQTTILPQRGFTLVELLIVMGMMVVLMAIALPSFMQWRQGLNDRSTARHIASILRQARSTAITQNLEQQVRFDATIRQYSGLYKGNQSYNSWTWSTTESWTTIPSSVTIGPVGVTTIQFTPSGASSAPGTIDIKDSSGNVRFQVIVSASGQIQVKQK